MANVDADSEWLSPLFFVSYARGAELGALAPAHDPDVLIRRFFLDLCQNVAALVGPPVGIDAGFIDRGLGAGKEWEPQLFDEVRRCQALIAMISPDFGRSEFCLREWATFAARKVVRRDGESDHEQAIVPVTWVPIATKRLPPSLRTIQRFSPEGAAGDNVIGRYHSYGIFGLLRTNQEETYLHVVWMLAMHIANICTEYWVEPGEVT